MYKRQAQERAKRENQGGDAGTKTAPNSDDEDEEDGSWLGIAFASHPTDADRIAFFKAAAQ